jgi:hypothetical protein
MHRSRFNAGLGLVTDAGEELAGRQAVDCFERKNGRQIGHPPKPLVPGDFRAASPAEKVRDVVLTKSPSSPLGAQIVVEVVLVHGGKCK